MVSPRDLECSRQREESQSVSRGDGTLQSSVYLDEKTKINENLVPSFPVPYTIKLYRRLPSFSRGVNQR